jgi:expansin
MIVRIARSVIVDPGCTIAGSSDQSPKHDRADRAISRVAVFALADDPRSVSARMHDVTAFERVVAACFTSVARLVCVSCCVAMACKSPPPPPPPPSPCGPPEPFHAGKATHYAADGTGQCSFDRRTGSAGTATPGSTGSTAGSASGSMSAGSGRPSGAGSTPGAMGGATWSPPLLVAAINDADYLKSARCGSCLVVVGPDESEILVEVVDRCPACKPGDLDLSRDAFALLAPLERGRIKIRWLPVPCEVDGPLAYHFKPGSNASWMAIQIRNHRYPIAAVEVLGARDDPGTAMPLTRADYNYFVGKGLGAGPHTLRITDSRGQTQVDTNVIGPDHVGSKQLPRCP